MNIDYNNIFNHVKIKLTTEVGVFDLEDSNANPNTQKKEEYTIATLTYEVDGDETENELRDKRWETFCDWKAKTENRDFVLQWFRARYK